METLVDLILIIFTAIVFVLTMKKDSNYFNSIDKVIIRIAAIAIIGLEAYANWNNDVFFGCFILILILVTIAIYFCYYFFY